VSLKLLHRVVGKMQVLFGDGLWCEGDVQRTVQDVPYAAMPDSITACSMLATNVQPTEDA
jgi:hypothetical protein